ncbi:MAG: autotransporter-associated beta strand repeat-containing protein [Clostridia bacterium]|nr:autotransporter-associated beta strand repeat-containing protein [Clostridia bacterium]MBR6798333.1 autotransporter-associated beta strand repeat-containing protein [Opitutales bacterium]
MKTSKFFFSTLIAASAMTATAYAGYVWNGGEITQEFWQTQDSWSLTDSSTWNESGNGPGTPNSNMWEPISISNSTGAISELEGWNLRLSLVGSELTVGSLKKFQGGSCSVSLDAASVLTISNFSGGSDGGSITLDNKGIFNLAYNKPQGGEGFVADLGETGVMNLTSVSGLHTAKIKSLSAVLGTTEETETKGGVVLSNYRNLITLGSGMSFDNTVTTFSFTNADGADITVRNFSEIFEDGISKNDDGTYGMKVEEGWFLLKDTSGYSVGYTAGDPVLALIWNGVDGSTWNTTDANWTESEGGESKVFANGGNVVFDKDANVVVDSAGVSTTCVGVFGGTVTLSGGKVTTQYSIFIEDGATLKLGSEEVVSGTIVVKTGGTFDLNGFSDGFSYAGGSVVLDGGFLTNTGNDVDIGKRQLHTLVLTADSTIGGENEFGIVGSGHGVTTASLGGFTLTKVGSGTVLFANNTLSNGVLDVAEGVISDGGKGLTIANDATLKVSGGSLNITGGFTNNGTLEFAADYTYSGSTLSGGTLKVTGGTAEIAGTASVKVVNISGGTLNVGDGGTLTVNDNTSLSGGDAVIGTINVLAGGTAKFSGHDLMGWDRRDNVIASLTGSEAKTATLMLNDTESLTFTSDIELNGNARVTTDRAEGSKLNTLGGRFIATGTNNEISSIVIQLRNTDFEVKVANRGDELKISSAIVNHAEGSSGLKKTGNGTLVLSGENTYTRATVVEAGTLVAASTSALGSGNVSVADGAKLQISVENVDAGTINLASGAKLVVDLADFADALGADNEMLTILTGTTLTFGDVSAASDTLTTEQLSYLSVTDSSGAFSKYVNKEWSYSDGTLSLTLTIPEPSAFGLLAGVGALVLVASRRRRSRR